MVWNQLSTLVSLKQTRIARYHWIIILYSVLQLSRVTEKKINFSVWRYVFKRYIKFIQISVIFVFLWHFLPVSYVWRIFWYYYYFQFALKFSTYLCRGNRSRVQRAPFYSLCCLIFNAISQLLLVSTWKCFWHRGLYIEWRCMGGVENFYLCSDVCEFAYILRYSPTVKLPWLLFAVCLKHVTSSMNTFMNILKDIYHKIWVKTIGKSRTHKILTPQRSYKEFINCIWWS